MSTTYKHHIDANLILKIMDQYDISYAELARQTGISRQAIQQILTSGNCRGKTKDNIYKYLDINKDGI
jgi:predicted DNA-binding protein (UPF0251 family)